MRFFYFGRWSIACRLITVFLIGTMISSPLASVKKIKVMPIGDSITSALHSQNSYRYWLWRALINAGIAGNVDFVGSMCGVGDDTSPPDCGNPPHPESEWDWDHEGRAFTTTSHLLNNINYILSLNVPDIALVHYGTNDFMIQGKNTQTPVTNLSIAIDSLRAHNPRVTVLLAQIIPYIGYSSDSVPVFNQKLALMAAMKTTTSSPVIIVDQYTGYDASSDNGMDNVHPNDDGHQKMASRWYPPLAAALQSSARISVSPTSPASGITVTEGDSINLRAFASAGTGVKRVDFYANASLIGAAIAENDTTFVIPSWRPESTGYDTIRVLAVDNRDSSTFSGAAIIRVNPAPVPLLSIMAIRDTTPASPYTGRRVGASGIVTAVRNDSTVFWLQDRYGDGNDKTPDGIRIDRAGIFYYHPHSGDNLIVRGRVAELQSPQSLSVTCIHADSIVVVGSEIPLPKPIGISYLPSNGSAFPDIRSILKRHEGMLVKIANGRVFAPSAALGEFAVVPPNISLPYLSPLNIPPVQLDPLSIVNYLPPVLSVAPITLATPPIVRPGDMVNTCVGVVTYDTSSAQYNIAPLADSLQITSQGPIPAYPVSKRSSSYAGSLRITTIDFGGLFDTLDAPGKSDLVVSAADYSLHIEKWKKAIINELLLPAILCAQGVENQAVLADLASRVNLSSGRGYKAISYESNDPAGLENGFLYDTLSVACEGARLLAAGVQGERQTCVGAFNYHWSRILVLNADFINRLADDKLFGRNWPPLRPSEALRSAQASTARSWIDSTLLAGRDSLIVATGRFNSYSFIEPGAGGSSATGIVRGDAAEKIRFTNIENYIGNPFTDVSEGRAGMFAHILLSPALARLAKGADILHFNAGWPASLSGDASTSVRAGTSDPVEVRF